MKRILEEKDGKVVGDANILAKIYSYEKMKAEIEPYEKQLKTELGEYFNNSNKATIELSDKVSAYVRKGCVRKTLDTAKLKEEKPNVYEKYLKESITKDSVVLEFN